jgi:alpha-tubulin suppressor-like RCC1 family protein
VVSLGLNFYGDNLCAVYGDGSLWCAGSNNSGQLGTGDFSPRPTPVMVQPPGSVRIGCS